VTGDAASGDINLDSDIKEALKTIKQLLLGDIQSALKREHDLDQTSVESLLKCWGDCKAERTEDQVQVDELWGVMKSHKTRHETCRKDVHAKYIVKIEKCNALDIWVNTLKCPECLKEECVVIRDPSSRKIGDMLQAHVTWATSSWEEWKVKHTACVKAVQEYNVADTHCDLTQGDFETGFCAHRQAEWTACDVNEMTCCAKCSKEFDIEVNRVECAEKDRKIDWSATKKIECYIDVLMASPTDEELAAKCNKDGKACINQWRENKYNECSEVCEDVDFETGDYSVVRGVNTTHRSAYSDGDRCTAHLDIHFPAQASCTKCPPPVPGPCGESFISTYYAEYDLTSPVPGLEDENECHPDVHQKWWAYSRAECRPCPSLIGRTPPAILHQRSLCAGTTPPGATDWKVYATKYIYLDVDTSKCKFADTPQYVTALQGTTNHWVSKGSSEVYNPTPTGFRIYIHMDEDMTPALANQRNYAIHWVAGSPQQPVPGVCEGQSASWRAYGGDMVQTVDTSACGFTDRPVYVTSMQGKTQHWTSTGSSEVYHASANQFTQYIDGSNPSKAASNGYITNYIAVDSASSSKGSCAGRTSENDWVQYSSSGIRVDVDTSKCGFETTPVYVSSLHGKSNHWMSKGSTELYSPTPTGFRIYISTTDDIVANQKYKGWNWQIEWIAVAQA